MNTVEPVNNKVRITPYAQRLLQLGINDSKLYFSQATNSLLQCHTLGYNYDEGEDPYEDVAIEKKYTDRKDCILNGLQTSFTLSGDSILTITIQPGNLIVDSTLLTFPEISVLDMDLNEKYPNTNDFIYDDSGFLVIAVFFKWIETIRENKPFLRLCHISSDGNDVLPISIPWSIDNHRLVITKFSFERINNVITNIINYLPDPFLYSEKQFVLIKNYSYEIGALSTQFHDVFRRIRQFYTFRIIRIISGIVSWIQSTPPFKAADTNYYYSIIDITEINRKDCLVQCYINDMTVQPAAIQHISNEEIRIWFPGYFVNQEILPDVKVIIMG